MDKKYLSKIVQGSDTLYIKDTEARESIANIETSITGGMHYIGETSTEIVDGSSVSTLTPKSEGSLAKLTDFAAGDIVIYGELEFVWNGSTWHEFGSTGSLKSLAFKDSASGSVTAAGSNAPSAVTFSGSASANFVTGYNDDAIAPSFVEGAFTQGTLPSFTEGAFSAGTLPSLGEATTGNFATEGETSSYNEATETLTFAAATKSAAVTAQGAFSAGSLPSKVADTWNAGTLPTKAADTFNAGSVATLAMSSAVTAIGTAEAAAQTFTGSAVSVSVS